MVRDKRVLQALERLLLVDAWAQKELHEDLTYNDGSKSQRWQCRSEEIFAEASPLLMPYWLEIMPNFKMENVLGWSIFWVTSANEALEAHFDELVEWCMAVVFSVGSSGKLRIKTHSGEDAPDKWISREITGNSLYILRGSEHKHMSQVCDGEPGRRGVLVIFVKDEKTWPTTPAMVASKIIPDVLPDYTEGMTAAERTQFLEEYEAWKAETKLELSEEKSEIKVRALNDDDRSQLAAWVDANDLPTTFGAKVYGGFKNLAMTLPALASEFDDIGKGLLETLNSKLPEDNRMVRMKNQELALLTYGPNAPRVWDFKQRKKKSKRKGQNLKGQLPHIDAPAPVPDIPVKIEPFYSSFVTMTPKRSATRMFFDMDLAELLGGKTWGKDVETNKWILRRLQFVHMRAFEIQAEKNQQAVKAGEWEVSEAGRVEWFRPGSRWHSGNVGLNESTLPEVVLLFEFAWEPIAKFFDERFNAAGGFGQHIWDNKVASTMLKEVQEHTFNMSQGTH